MKLTAFATSNPNKLREVNAILGLELEQVKLDLSEPQALRIEEVVFAKAKDAYEKAGRPVLVDDTALDIVAWNGLPGALIKWFLESVGTAGILKMLEAESNRAATARCAIGFFDGAKAYIFIGETKGDIAPTIRGNTGFGWDPIFIPQGSMKSYGEMSLEEKNTISHRYRALQKLRDFLADKAG